MKFLDNKITLDFSKYVPCNGPILYLGDSIGKKLWYQPFYRIPWDDIPAKRLAGCNMAFTLNGDCRVEFDVYDRKVSNSKLFDVLHLLKNKNILEKITLVYEYGEKGKEHGKLHYHGIVKVTDRQTFEKEILKVFNKNLNVRHRTLQTKLFKTCEDRERYVKYMKKESQNKKKCLLSI